MLFQVTIFPTDNKTAGVSVPVAQIIDLIDNSGLPYKVSSMSTVIEGDWPEVMDLINKCRLKLREEHSRLYIVISVDDRRGAENRLTGKNESVEKHLGRKVKK